MEYSMIRYLYNYLIFQYGNKKAKRVSLMSLRFKKKERKRNIKVIESTEFLKNSQTINNYY